MENFYKIMRERRTIRKFKSQEVPKELLERIIKESMWAPSAMNTQPWEVYVFSGEARDRISKILGDSIKGLTPRLQKLFNEKMQKFIHGFFRDFGGAPVIIIVLSNKVEEEVYQQGAFQSCAALIQNLLLAAHAEGLGACWMTGPLWVEKELLMYLGREKDTRLVAAIPIGYPDQEPPVPSRKHEKIHWINK